MMQSLDSRLFYEESFTDFLVTETKINIPCKNIIISTRGAWLDRDEKNILNEVEIFIKEWNVMKVSIMNEDSKLFEILHNPEEYLLSDIIKFYYKNNTLKLTGFGINGGWIEWEFINPSVTIQGNIE